MTYPALKFSGSIHGSSGMSASSGRRVGTTTVAFFSAMWASSRQTNSLTRSARSVQLARK